MILVIDNYDSFVYNLARYVTELGGVSIVKRCDEVDLVDIKQMPLSHIIISPGPGTPESAGISMRCVQMFQGVVPILGICLGHQAIAQALGGKVVRAPYPCHGQPDEVYHDGTGLYGGLHSPLTVGRYHSLIVSDLPGVLQINARNSAGLTMGLQHRSLPIFGMQFHPESVLTQGGHQIIKNFLSCKSIDFQSSVQEKNTACL